jgi:FecR-like protein/putative zinc finger protein
MKGQTDKVRLDEAIALVREDEAPTAAAAAAAARVADRLQRESVSAGGSVHRIEGCADVRALLPAYAQGTLPEARVLLVTDHLQECATCRALERHPGRVRLAVLPWRADSPSRAEAARSWRAHAIAASVLLALGLSGFGVRQAFFGVPAGSRAAVQSVSGVLQRVAANDLRPLAPGDEIGEAEVVRTASGSQAVLRLRDGSLLELGERAEVAVSLRGRDTTVRLGRGSIIVQAAKRRQGHLRVASNDCTVSVTGTVFSVTRSVKGSRVSVIEGEVHVDQSGADKVLHPGDQLSTSAALEPVSLPEEIGWSRDRDQHLALLGELAVLRKDLKTIRMPELRYESRLLERVPQDAVVYGSVPNYGEALAEGYKLFEARLQTSPLLREWWQEVDPARHHGPKLDELVEKVHSFAAYLGDEVVFTTIHDGPGRSEPVFLAEVRRDGLREFLEGELSALAEGHGEGPRIRILDEEQALRGLPPARDELFVLLRDDLIAVAPQPGVLGRLARHLRDGGPGLDQTAFGRRIGSAYAEGAGLLFAANLEGVVRQMARPASSRRGREPASLLGIDDVRQVIVERKEVGGTTVSHVDIGFGGPRHGIASWLGSPAPMGALDFVSTQASLAGAFVVKSPALLLDDLLAFQGTGPEARREMAQVEAKLKLRIREDLAEALGGEFAFALDGPILPTPAWKVVVEVYDPSRLQSAIQALVAAWNDEAQRDGWPGLRLEAEQSGDRTYYALRPTDARFPVEVHYAFDHGYLVAAPSRALVARALETRESGERLAQSDRFRSLFPADGQTNVSAVLYQNFAPLMKSLADGASLAGEEQRGAVAALAGATEPSLVCAYGEPDRIQVAGLGGLFDLDLSGAALPLMLGRLIPGTEPRAHP